MKGCGIINVNIRILVDVGIKWNLDLKLLRKIEVCKMRNDGGKDGERLV